MDTERADSGKYGIAELLGMARERVVPLVAGLPDGALGASTPCAEYDVKALVNHLFQVVVEFQKLAAKGTADFSGAVPDLVGTEPGWRERFAGETDRLVAAWAAPGAEEGVAGGWGMPAPLVGAMALLDLTVHGWDLARATGVPYPVDEELAPVVDRLAVTVAELGPTARSTGVFGEPVAVGADASAFERLLAGTGRDPGWAGRG
ncbi:TIGR03086 family metal-binding protein [Streptomyces sp. NPDC048290]|uniref:TIGR03086 family metal-binding protein n=1 Tax=Streptomyces sp. NPDC048290 TaxID=3155811 RepID=UPI0034138C37